MAVIIHTWTNSQNWFQSDLNYNIIKKKKANTSLKNWGSWNLEMKEMLLLTHSLFEVREEFLGVPSQSITYHLIVILRWGHWWDHLLTKRKGTHKRKVFWVGGGWAFSRETGSWCCQLHRFLLPVLQGLLLLFFGPVGVVKVFYYNCRLIILFQRSHPVNHGILFVVVFPPRLFIANKHPQKTWRKNVVMWSPL